MRVPYPHKLGVSLLDIFVGNAPPHFTRAAMQQLFIKTIAKSRKKFFFWKRQGIHKVQVKQIIKQASGKPRRYFVVHIKTNEVALLAIRRLNLKTVEGHRLMVREHHTRGYMNERRAVNWRERPWGKTERRKSERRTIQQGDDFFSALDEDASGVRFNPDNS